MNTSIRDIETSATGALESLSASARQCYSECEESIRRAPVTTVLGAAAVGYLFRFIPLGLVLAGSARLAVALAKPAVLLLGAAKVVEFLQTNGRTTMQRDPAPEKPGTALDPIQESPPGPPEG